MTIVVAIHDLPVWSIPPEQVARLVAALPGDEVIDARDAGERARAFPRADVLFATKLKPGEFATAPAVKWIQSSAVGVGALLLPEVVASGVTITNARGVHSEAIAEHAIALALALRRQFHRAAEGQRAHAWLQADIAGRRVPPASQTRMLVVGLGSIGARVAGMAAGLGMRVIGVRRRADAPPVAGVQELLPPDRLRDGLAEADVIVLAVPRTELTRALIGEAEFAAMKPSAVLVNVARGRLVDEAAMIAALAGGRIGGAGLDAFHDEPLPAASPLWDLPNVIVTPHTAAFAGDYWAPCVDLFLENLARFRAGEPLLNVVDKGLGYEVLAAELADLGTIAVLPFFASGRYPKPDLIGHCRGGRIALTSGRELLERVRDISLGLTAMGLAAGDRVALVAESRPEWLLADFAILTAAAVTVPIYPTLSAEQAAFILRDSGATMAVLSNRGQLDKLLSAPSGVPSLRTAILIDAGDGSPSAAVAVHTLADVEGMGHRRILDGWGVAREFQDRARAVSPADLATIVYTSGTTGDPKGVELTHGNLAANIAGVRAVLDLNESDTALSFLPLCHAFERMVSYVYLATGVSVVFAESFDTVGRDLLLVKPTVMTGVPRAFEKLHARVVAKGREATGVKRRIFDRALAVADALGACRMAGRPPGVWLAWQARVADRMVFAKIREGVGGRWRFVVSGSAPLREDTLRFFLGAGLPLLEGYGLTEAGPVVSVTPFGGVRPGSVGPPLPGVRVRVAEDGELLVQGPSVMRAYHHRPEDTAEALKEGWLATGDIGSIDPDGYVRVTDRKKELLVTSGGKKVAPQPIESALRAHALVADALIVGDGRHFLSTLIVPDFREVCRRVGVDPPADAAATRLFVARPDVRALFQQVLDEINAPLAQFERLKQFALLAADFGADASAVTPTMKVKRKVVERAYRVTIDAMYGV